MKEVSDLKNIKGKAAGYDRTIGLFEAFRRWQGYHDVGLSMSLHLIHRQMYETKPSRFEVS